MSGVGFGWLGLLLLLSDIRELDCAAQELAREKPPFRQAIADLTPGMKIYPVELREKLGPPDHLSRQILFGKYVEQWAYDQEPGWLIEIGRPVGGDRDQAPKIRHILSPTPPRQ